jgi:hypothetical protein
MRDPEGRTLVPPSLVPMAGRSPRGSRNRFATPSFACAIVSLPCLLALYLEFLAVLPALVGIVLGVIALVEIHRSGGTQSGWISAAAGIAVGLLGGTVAIILSTVLVASM